jgi:large subunit ribosomal protein L21
MYAIIENGGKQYKIEEGKRVRLEKLSNNQGDTVEIHTILSIVDGATTILGNPYVSGAYIQGKVLSQGKDKKVTVFKYKRRKDSKTKRGHRQAYTELLIEKIHMEEVSHGT